MYAIIGFMEQLTQRQKQILIFVSDFSADFGITPTIREIAEKFNISIGPVQKHIKALIRKGYIKHTPRISRGIDLSFRKPVISVPVLGRVPAGIPLEPLETAQDYVYIDKALAKAGNYFALNVRGDSMTGSNIFENDVVIVRQQQTAENNDIVVALIDGEATVKKLRKEGKKIYLQPTNPKYKPIHSQNLKILGKVVYLTRRII